LTRSAVALYHRTFQRLVGFYGWDEMPLNEPPPNCSFMRRKAPRPCRSFVRFPRLRYQVRLPGPVPSQMVVRLVRPDVSRLMR